jgi:hypothetical protein
MEKAPKIRSFTKIAKSGVLALLYDGFEYQIGLVDMETTFTKEQQESADQAQ